MVTASGKADRIYGLSATGKWMRIPVPIRIGRMQMVGMEVIPEGDSSRDRPVTIGRAVAWDLLQNWIAAYVTPCIRKAAIHGPRHLR